MKVGKIRSVGRFCYKTCLTAGKHVKFVLYSIRKGAMQGFSTSLKEGSSNCASIFQNEQYRQMVHSEITYAVYA